MTSQWLPGAPEAHEGGQQEDRAAVCRPRQSEEDTNGMPANCHETSQMHCSQHRCIISAVFHLSTADCSGGRSPPWLSSKLPPCCALCCTTWRQEKAGRSLAPEISFRKHCLNVCAALLRAQSALEATLGEDLLRIWDSVSKPAEIADRHLNDFFDVSQQGTSTALACVKALALLGSCWNVNAGLRIRSSTRRCQALKRE